MNAFSRTRNVPLNSIFEPLEPRILLSGTTEYDITFTLANDSDISLIVSDADGRIVREFMRSESMLAGTHTIKWDGLDFDGNAVDPNSTYSWKLLETQGLTAEYAFTLGTNSPSPGQRWVGDHHGPASVGVDATGIYFGAEIGEAGNLMTAIFADGSSLLWQKQQYTNGAEQFNGHGPTSFVSNGTDVFGLIALDEQVRVYRNSDGLYHSVFGVAHNNEAPVDMDVVGSEMVLVYSEQNLVRWVNAYNGSLIASATVNNPTSVTMIGDGADGEVLVVSGNDIVSLTRNNPTPITRISGLEFLVRIDVDHTTGDIFVAEGGASQQIKRFDSNYQILQTYGKAGGRSTGVYINTDFKDVVDLAADGSGKLYLVEDGPVRRTVAINISDGSVDTEYYGGMKFYPGVTFDPIDPTNVWADNGAGHLTQYIVDYANNTWTINATYQYNNIGDGLFPPETEYSGQWTPITIGGEQHLYLSSRAAILKVDQANGVLIPVSTAGTAVNIVAGQGGPNGSGTNNYPSSWEDAINYFGYTNVETAPKTYSWADIDEDGLIDPEEFTFYTDIVGHNGATSAYFDRSSFEYLFSFDNSQKAYYTLSLDRWIGTNGNIPVWEWDDYVAGPDMPDLEVLDDWTLNRGIYRDSDGNVYQAIGGNFFGEKYSNFWPTNELGSAQLIKWDSSGNFLGIAGEQGLDKSEQGTGVLYYPMAILGETNNTIAVLDRTANGAVFYTKDGLFVGTPFDNRINDGLLDEVYTANGPYTVIPDDAVNGGLVELSNGDIYWYAPGVGNNSVYKITGFDALITQSGAIDVTVAPFAPSKLGDGLTGHYYSDSNLRTLVKTQIDSQVKFDWADGSPEGLPVDNWSASWVGEFEAKFSEEYTFTADVYGDDAVRVYIGDVLVIDGWSGGSGSGTLYVEAGRQYPIRIDFRDDGGNAKLTLRYESQSQRLHSVEQSALYTAPSGHWRFDESVGNSLLDSSGHGNEGTINGGVTRVNGQFESGLSFNGTDGFVRVLGSESLNPSSGITVSARAKSSTATWNASDSLVSMTESYMLAPIAGTKDIEFRVHDGTTWHTASFALTHDITEWHLYTGVYDGSNVMLYIDGVLQASTSFSGEIVTDIAPLYIGSELGLTKFFDGVIDDVRVYDRALTSVDVFDMQREVTARPIVRAEIIDIFAHEDGVDTAVFRIHRDGETTSDLTVNYNMSGTATNGSDYETLSGVVVIPAGSSSVDIVAIPMIDAVTENRENIELNLVEDATYTIGTVDSDSTPNFIRLYDPSAQPLGELEDFSINGTWAEGFGNQHVSDAPRWANSNDAEGAGAGEVKAINWSAHDFNTGYWDGSLDPEIVWNVESSLNGSGRIKFPTPPAMTGTNTPLRFIGYAGDQLFDYVGGAIGLAVGVNEIGIGVYRWSGPENVDKFSGVPISGDFLNNPIDFDFQWDPATLMLTATLTPLNGAPVNLSLSLTTAEYNSLRMIEFDKFGVIGFQHNFNPYGGSFTIYADDLTYSSPVPSAELAKVSVEATDPTLNELVENQSVFTISREHEDIRNPLTVYYTLGGTAASADYIESPTGSVTIAAGELSATVVVTPVNDGLIEGDETVELIITPNAYYDIGEATDTATITDSGDLSEPTLEVTAINSAAFEQGSDIGVFEITRTGNPGVSLYVNYTIDGTASSADFIGPASGTVVLPFGVSSKTFRITPIDDSLVEGGEKVVMTILPGTGYSVGASGDAAVFITDDDMPLAPIQHTAMEVGAPNTGNMFTLNDLDEEERGVFFRTTDPQQFRTYGYVFGGVVAAPTIKIHQDTLNGTRARIETVNVYTSNGKQTYSGLPDQDEITLHLEGVTSFILVEHVASFDNHPDKNIALTELVVSSGPITPMTNHSLNVTITVDSASWNYGGPTGIQNSNFLSQFLNQNEIDSSGNVNLGQDVKFDFGSAVTINSLGVGVVPHPSSMLKDFRVDFATDANFANIVHTENLTAVELHQYHSYDLSASVTAQYARIVPLTVHIVGPTPTVVGLSEVQFFGETVASYQALPQVNIQTIDANASEAGSDSGQFIVTRTGDTTNALMVYYSVSGTASAGDYTQTLGGTLEFLAGESTATIDITPVDDSTTEGIENVVITIDADPSYLIGAGVTGEVDIAASDIPTVTVTATDNSGSETGPDAAVFTFTRSSPTSDMNDPLTVNYSVGGSTTYIPPISEIVQFNTSNTTVNQSPWLLGQAMVAVGTNGQIGYLDGYDSHNPDVFPNGRAGSQFGFLLTDNPSDTYYDPASPQRLATISGFTLTGDFGGAQAGLKDITLHYGNNQSMQITLPATPGSQTYTFTTPIVTSYLYFTAEEGSFYQNELGFGNNLYMGISSFSFEGYWGDTLVNTNVGATVSTTGGSAAGADSLVNDGSIFYNGIGRYWQRDTDTDSITMTYSEPKTIGSIGLGLSLQADFRPQASQVTLTYDGGSEVIDLRNVNLAYGVYELSNPITTTSLTLTFPDGALGDDWSQIGSDPYYGITEFQAFEPVAYMPTQNDADFDLTSHGTVVIPAGQTSVTVTLTPIDDTVYEGSETTIFTVESGDLYTIGTQSSDTVTIQDNEPVVSTVTIAATDAVGSEAGPDDAVFTITRTMDIADEITVNYVISGTTTSGDYVQTLTGSVVIAENEATATINVTPIDDSEIEYDETLTLTLDSGSLYQIGRNDSASIMINDNDQPEVTVLANDAIASEINSDPGQFTITRNTTIGDLTIEYALQGTASDLDYTEALIGSVIIPEGETQAVIDVTPFDDLIAEGPEDLVLSLLNTNDYNLGAQSSDTVTIDDAGLTTLSIVATDASAAEFNADTATFTVTRTGDTSNSLTFKYQVSGTADSGDIQEVLTGIATIDAGQTSVAITVTPVDDTLIEGVEDIVVTLVAANNGQSTNQIAAWFRGGEDNDADQTTTSDSAGNNMTLTASGTPSQEVAASPVAGSTGVYQFNGSTEAQAYGVADPTISHPATTATDNFVVEAWVTPQNIAFSGEQAIVSNGTIGGGYEFLLYDGEWAIHYPFRLIQSFGPATENVWTHLAWFVMVARRRCTSTASLSQPPLPLRLSQSHHNQMNLVYRRAVFQLVLDTTARQARLLLLLRVLLMRCVCGRLMRAPLMSIAWLQMIL